MADIKNVSSTQTTITNSRNASSSSSAGMTKYHMYYTTSRMNVTLHKHHASTPAIYYMKSVCSLTKILLHLRQGDTKSSPMIAFAKLLMTSRHMQLGRGDYYQQPENLIAWDDLRRAKNIFCRSDYQFATSVGSESGKKVEFEWCKDRSKFAATVYECVNKSDGMSVAKMFSGGALNWSKAGEIEIAEDLDEGLKEMLMVSALAIWAMEAFAYQSWFTGFESTNGERKAEAERAHQA